MGNMRRKPTYYYTSNSARQDNPQVRARVKEHARTLEEESERCLVVRGIPAKHGVCLLELVIILRGGHFKPLRHGELVTAIIAAGLRSGGALRGLRCRCGRLLDLGTRRMNRKRKRTEEGDRKRGCGGWEGRECK